MYSSRYMAQFLVVGEDEDDGKLGHAVAQGYPDNYIKAWTGAYLVSDESAVAQQVSAKLGVVGGGIGRVLIVTIGGYAGWAPKTVWEWLAVKGTPHVPSA